MFTQFVNNVKENKQLSLLVFLVGFTVGVIFSNVMEHYLGEGQPNQRQFPVEAERGF